VPAVFVAVLVADVAAVLSEAIVAFARESPAVEVAGMTPSDVSIWVSARLMLMVGIGLPLSVGLGLLALVTLLPLPAAPLSAGVRRYGWGVAAVTVAAAAWLLIRFSSLLTRIADSPG
jgi:hypothetical protein